MARQKPHKFLTWMEVKLNNFIMISRWHQKDTFCKFAAGENSFSLKILLAVFHVVLYFLHELIGCLISKDLSGWACSYKVKKCWIAAGFRWTWSPVAVTVFWRTRDLCRFKVIHLGDQAYECRFTIRAFSLNLFEPIVLRSLPSTVERTVVNFMLCCLSRLFYHPWCQIRLSLHKS